MRLRHCTHIFYQKAGSINQFSRIGSHQAYISFPRSLPLTSLLNSLPEERAPGRPAKAPTEGRGGRREGGGPSPPPFLSSLPLSLPSPSPSPSLPPFPSTYLNCKRTSRSDGHPSHLPDSHQSAHSFHGDNNLIDDIRESFLFQMSQYNTFSI